MRLRAIAIALVVLTTLPVARAAEPPPAPVQQKDIEDLTVLGVRDKLIRDFVRSYAAPTRTLIGQLARWRAGICPVTAGLSKEFNTFVTARIKDVAREVGAPVEPKEKCKVNLQVIFSPNPQAQMDAVRIKAAWMLGSHYKAEEKELATVTHTIQSWYATATNDYNGQTTLDDIGDISGKCEYELPPAFCGPNAAGPCKITASVCAAVRPGRTGSGFRSEFALVTIVVDMKKVADIEIGPVADYIAMAGLAQTKATDTCRGLPSISNLLTKDCPADRKANALTQTDIAYLRALYQMNAESAAGLQQIDLANWMRINLDGK